MSEKDLCFKCREAIAEYYPSTADEVMKFQHCHHEPKEKEKCWCSSESNTKQTWHAFEGIPGYYAVFCPQCGRKL